MRSSACRVRRRCGAPGADPDGHDGRPHLQVTLVEEPVAAALSSGVDLDAGNAVPIVDIGGSTADAGMVVADGIARSRSIR